MTNKEEFINIQAKASGFTSKTKSGIFLTLKLFDHKLLLKKHMIDVPISNIDAKIICKFTSDSEFSVKRATWDTMIL